MRRTPAVLAWRGELRSGSDAPQEPRLPDGVLVAADALGHSRDQVAARTVEDLRTGAARL